MTPSVTICSGSSLGGRPVLTVESSLKTLVLTESYVDRLTLTVSGQSVTLPVETWFHLGKDFNSMDSGD